MTSAAAAIAGRLARSLFVPADEWAAAFRLKTVRRACFAVIALGLLACVYGVFATWPDRGQVMGNVIIGGSLAVALAGIARNGVRSINIQAPAVCVAFASACVLGVYVVLIGGSAPAYEVGGITRWAPMFFLANAMCFRPAGARLVSGLTALGIAAAATMWLAQPGNFRPGERDSDAVTYTYAMLAAALLAQECAVAFRERQAGLRAATRKSLIEQRRRGRVELELQRMRDDLQRMNRISIVNATASTLAHEISQPLGAMAGFSRSAGNWLDRSPPNLERARASLDNLREEVRRARGVIEGVRALTTRSTAPAEPVAIEPLVRSVARLVERDCALRGISLRIDVAPTAGSVLGRGAQLQQVLLNLLNNAVEALEGRRNPVVQVRVDRPAPGAVRLRVIDNGPGIPAAALASLDKGLFSTKPQGTGLGLVICREIVESHGGTLAFDSGRSGVTVSLLLPAAAGEPAAPVAARRAHVAQ